MKILIACEESQAVCKEFRALGFEAYSCDTLSCSGGKPEWHLKMDAFDAIQGGNIMTEAGTVVNIVKWDKIISFQPCTDIANSGAKHFEKKRNNGIQEKSIRFFFEIWKLSDCSENPAGIINGGKYIKKWFPILWQEMKDNGFPFKPTQIIQPYMFGDPVKKTTCLWLKGLPPLKETNNVESEVKYYTSKNGAKMSEWYAKQIIVDGKKCGYNTEEFKKHRSKTFDGVAKAMALQWSKSPIVKTNVQLELDVW